MVALVAGDNFIAPKFLTADVVNILLREVGVIVGDRRTRGLEFLHRRCELLLLHLESGFVDRHLLPVVAIVEPCQQRARRHPLAFVEWQFNDPRLHGFETDDAFVGFDVAGNEQVVGRRLVREEHRITRPRTGAEYQDRDDEYDSLPHAS